jgi:hypothetical protein
MASRNEPEIDREDHRRDAHRRFHEPEFGSLSAVFRAQAGLSVPTFAGTTAAIDHRGLAVQYRKRNPAVVAMLLFTKKLFDNPPLNSVYMQPR